MVMKLFFSSNLCTGSQIAPGARNVESRPEYKWQYTRAKGPCEIDQGASLMVEENQR